MRGIDDASEALRAVQAYLARPESGGLLIHVRRPGVDLAINLVAERAGAYVARCGACRHVARLGEPPGLHPRCPRCLSPALETPAFRGDLAFRTYAWVLRWPREGMEGVGLGPLVDFGRFTDAGLAAGMRRIQECLTVDVHAMEAAGVTNAQDLAYVRRAAP